MKNPFESIEQRLTIIEGLLKDLSQSPRQNTVPVVSDELLTVPAAAKFLSLSIPTIYSLISKNAIPVMKRSKRCYFSKAELIDYLKQGKKKTLVEINAQAVVPTKKRRS